MKHTPNTRLRPLLFATMLTALSVLTWSTLAASSSDDDDGFNVPPTAPTGQRQGGGARGESTGKPYKISILAPADSVGLTSRQQPVIYWYLSQDADVPIRISVLAPKTPKPVFAEELPAGTKAGLHKIDLAAAKQGGKPVKLDPSMMYNVVVKVMSAGSGSAGDPFASCRILKVEPDQAAANAAKEPDPAKRAAAYGKAGLWFDYLDALNEAIAANPKDDSLVQKRTKSLAKQRLIWKPDGTITEERPAKP